LNIKIKFCLIDCGLIVNLCDQFILRAQGNVWTESMETTNYVEYMILPRMTALSEVVWSSKEGKNWEDFRQPLNHISKRYDAMKLNYAKHSVNK